MLDDWINRRPPRSAESQAARVQLGATRRAHGRASSPRCLHGSAYSPRETKAPPLSDLAVRTRARNGWRQSSTPTGRYPFRPKSRARPGRPRMPSSSGAPSRALTWPGTEPRTGCFALEGRTLPRNDPAAELFGHDSTAVGWPWVEGTHSWVEPTAMAILALCREGLSGHSRVEAGIHLFLDRSLNRGGWNFGNPAVFGRELAAAARPLWVGPAGARRPAGKIRPNAGAESTTCVQALGEIRTGASLSWGVLGLAGLGCVPSRSRELACANRIRDSERAAIRRPASVCCCWPRPSMVSICCSRGMKAYPGTGIA